MFNNSRSIGVVYGILAYLAWGLLPIYWKQVETASADEILSHRIVRSLALALYTSKSLLHHRPRRIIPSAPAAPSECPESSG